jgi:hypothetical protein
LFGIGGEKMDKQTFQEAITKKISHLDCHDQNYCRAALTAQLIALASERTLDTIWRAFDEYVEHYYSQTPAMRILERAQLAKK